MVSTYKKRKLKEVELPAGVVIGALLRGRNTIIPHGDSDIIAGDHLLAFCTPGLESEVRSVFQ